MQRQARGSRTDKLQRLFALASSQAGYFTASQARELGYSLRSLVHHVDAGHLGRVSRGFYRLVGVAANPHEDVIAAWLKFSPRQAVVSHDTALALYDLAPSRSHEVHLTVPRERRPRTVQTTRGAKLHTTTVPLRRDEIVNRFGVRLTSPSRTIADLAEIGADPSVVVEAIGRALGSGLVTREELQAAAKNRSLRVRLLVERSVRETSARA